MRPGLTPWVAAGLAAFLAAAFCWLVRLPLPFDGFAAVAATGLAFLGTLTLMSLMPRRWVWTDAEQLRHAYQARHGVSDYAADSALGAITAAHLRAETLRRAAQKMRADVADQIGVVADRLDAAAREIFYDPGRHRDLRAVLVRSELIEDAAKAHAALRARQQADTEDQSRDRLLVAVDALNAAFDQTDLLAARGLLAEVDVASSVAETVLKPRHPLTS